MRLISYAPDECGGPEPLFGYGQNWMSAYLPPIGGMILVGALFFFWITVLNCWRIRRPLGREPRIWIGFGLALVAPIIEVGKHLSNASP